ncbi:MAG: outer membrane protein assembly factor BamD [Ignavibacteria bacterium]|jgi:outer membrane protein assembly factor BamD
MKNLRITNFLSVLILAIVIYSCSTSGVSDIKTDDPEKAMLVALKNYDKKEYLQAIDDFSLIKIKFSGTKIADKAQYYLAMCYYQREEFILSASEFENLIKNYSTSPYAIQGRYQLAMCYYGLSPDYALDQVYTKYAIIEFQNFLELYPNEKLAPDAEAKIKELKNKLAFKEYKSGELYMTMENYKAAIYYYENVLQEYFDTDYSDDALYGKIKALIQKKKSDDALKEIDRFEKKFPKSEYLSRVERIKSSLKNL